MDRRSLLRAVVAASLTPAFASIVPAFASTRDPREKVYTTDQIYDLAQVYDFGMYSVWAVMDHLRSSTKKNGKILVVEHRGIGAINPTMLIFADKFVVVTRHDQRIVHKDTISGRRVPYVEA